MKSSYAAGKHGIFLFLLFSIPHICIMRIAHFILVHKDPVAVERLIKTLQHENFDFYIHVDKKANIKDYLFLGKLPNVSFIKKRIDVIWAGYTLTKAMLVPMEEIIATGIQYDFINHLSGQDYPLKSPQYINDFFEGQKGKSFIYSFNPDEDPVFWKDHMFRITRWHMTNYRFRGRFRVENLLNKIFPHRKFPLPYTVYGGASGYWTISYECAKYVIDFMAAHPEVERFGKFMWGSDEVIIPTIVMNSPLKDTVVRDHCRYIYFPKGEANPKILTTDDFDTLKNSGKLFARKFDRKKDGRILDMLDELINQESKQNLLEKQTI